MGFLISLGSCIPMLIGDPFGGTLGTAVFTLLGFLCIAGALVSDKRYRLRDGEALVTAGWNWLMLSIIFVTSIDFLLTEAKLASAETSGASIRALYAAFETAKSGFLIGLAAIGANLVASGIALRRSTNERAGIDNRFAWRGRQFSRPAFKNR